VSAELLDAALATANRGRPVFPLRAPRNTPAIPSAHPQGDPMRGKCRGECGRDGHGFHDATTDPDTIRRWWTTYPDANIGVRTGVAFDVLDVDHDDFLTGVSALPDCETSGGPVVRTGSGRFHIYFLPSGLGRRIRFSQHCDWLGTNGYVVVPPSTHRTGRRYEWFAPPDLPLTAAPAELLAAVQPAPPPRSMPTASANTAHNVQASGWSPAGLVGCVAMASKGSRNDVLNWASHKVGYDVYTGRVAESDALEALDQLAVAAERSGLTGGEVDTTIRSGYSSGRDGRGASRQ